MVQTKIADADSEESRVALSLLIDTRINVAMQQNDVPVIKEGVIRNNTDTAIEDCVFRVTSEPAFARETTVKISRVPSGGEHRLETQDLDLALSPEFLFRLEERVAGFLHISLGNGDEVLHESHPVELLAYNEWGGLRGLPEILAAFVLPNDPVVQHILGETVAVLREWQESSDLCGYQQRSPAHVSKMVAALYEALLRQHFTYINPPASFEEEGQKIRTPSRLQEERMGTCLDLALLACGCMEQMGLHPFVVLIEGHAFAAVWLTEETFPLVAVYEGSSLRKRVDLGEILAFDPTACTSSNANSLQHALSAAKRHLSAAEKFQCAIDIKRARWGRIRPLPLRSEAPNLPSEPEAPASSRPSALVLPPELTMEEDDSRLDRIVAEGEDNKDTPQGRLAAWQNRLLDLTLHNRLLNFRETKQTLPVLSPNLATLEDGLAEGEGYHILAAPKEFDPQQSRNMALHQQRTGEDPLALLLREQLNAGRLHTSLTDNEVEARLLKLYRNERTSLEESGVSGLYLALGFLKWFENKSSRKKREAPLILIPVTLTRTTVRGGFRLERSDDDPRFNTTLLELLRRDHGVDIPELTDELPEDEAGLDVPRILRVMKRAMRDERRWEVVEKAAVGFFMFTKFMMWADLRDRANELMSNDVVRHLVESPDLPFQPDATLPAPEELDVRYAPADTFCPVNADSSQLAAVFAAAEGRSFVLQGPPGTGKSQTITNLIAHCLAQGQTVLFVSEKMAALNVVRDRLERIGLGPFCLELHSNKANKKEVLRQFKEVIEYGRRQEPNEWGAQARELQKLRIELDEYVNVLHRRHRNGLTPFQAIDELVGLRSAPSIPLDWDNPDAHTAEDLSRLKATMEMLAVLGRSVEPVERHPWKAVRQNEWSISWQRDVERQLKVCRETLSRLRRAEAHALEALKLELAVGSPVMMKHIVALVGLLIECPDLPAGLFEATGWSVRQSEIEQWLKKGRAASELYETLGGTFNVGALLELDVAALDRQWQLSQTAFSLFKWWKRRPLIKLLQTTLHKPSKLRVHEASNALKNGKELKSLLVELEKVKADALRTFGAEWQGAKSDWDELENRFSQAQQIRDKSARLVNGDPELTTRILDHWAKLLPDACGRFAAGTDRCNALQQLTNTWQSWTEEWAELSQALQIDDAVLDAGVTEDWLKHLDGVLKLWCEEMGRLHNWCIWQDKRMEALKLGLNPLVCAFETGEVTAKRLPETFTRAYLEWWYNGVNESQPVLRKFSRLLHENRIEKFRELDSDYMETTRQMVIARLAANLPMYVNEANPNSELGRLNREIQKRARHMPIRKLLHGCQGVVHSLKPCFLMSPLSVAQYLAPDHPRFDLIVFDEASQIPVWDAVGAIARGERAIIVGDPKQLPPTSFFSRIEDDSELTDDYVEDMESILDECIAASLPQLKLNWHYRSQHEDLIAFSNYHYYDNNLLTFPAAVGQDLGVHLHPVPGGTYDKGKSRTNRAEADKVVRMVIRALTDPASQEYSVGVVTFSQAQQTLIDDLLEKARMEKPEIEFAFSSDVAEPVFVKNLENVQGDERDAMIFSICYGPDRQGRVSMNFGPLNQNGGERRLNVAITRARRWVHVISTLRAEQIDLTRTQALGVRHLKSFLEYAERGPAVLGATAEATDAGSDSPLEDEIAEGLRERGWKVHHQVGCSGYRIDLAIVDPEAPGDYLLGIECDGATYHRSKIARDRDKLRQTVLENLGWRIHRVWSTDWWLSPDGELKRIQATLRECNRPGMRSSTANGANTDMTSDEPPNAPVEPARVEAPTLDETYEQYRVCETTFGNAEEFDGGEADNRILESINTIAQVECPISSQLLLRRVADAWQIPRLTRRRRGRIKGLIEPDDFQQVDDNGISFYWLPQQNPEQYDSFRTHPEDDAFTRGLDDIPTREVQNAMKHILATQGGLPHEDLIREAARLFNCRRVSAKAKERLFVALQALMDSRAVG